MRFLLFEKKYTQQKTFVFTLVLTTVLNLLILISFGDGGGGVDGAMARRDLPLDTIYTLDDAAAEEAKQKVRRAVPPAGGKRLPGPTTSVGGELNSATMDSDVVNKLGTVNLKPGVLVDRKRRDHRQEQYHEHKAEADSIAAAAEAAAAEADAVAAAVEASEALESGENDDGGGGHQFTNNFDETNDNSITFEEDEDGNDMVALEEDSREKEHEGSSGFDHGSRKMIGSASLYATNADSHQDETESEADSRMSLLSQSTNMLHAVDASSLNLIKELDSHPDVDLPLSKLLDESKDIAREIRLVFQVLAKREEYLVREMEKLKRALANAVHVLQENNEVNEVSKLVRKKRDDYYQTNDPSSSYKACVYITPPERQVIYSNVASPEQLIQEGPPTEPPFYDQLPPQQDYYVSQVSSESESTNNNGYDDIDLSSVYWLKLPAGAQEGVLEKMHRVITTLRQSGRDLLLIPVKKGFTSEEDLARGFLRAVRVNPASQNTKGQKRKKLRLRFRRV